MVSRDNMTIQSPNQGEASTRAVLSLVFGILGLTVLPCAGPIIAIVTGTGEPGGLAKAGVILGWIALGLYAFFGALALLLLLFGGMTVMPFVN